MLGPTNSRRSVHASSCVHRLGQGILFDNKTGASGMLGAEFVTYAKANPGKINFGSARLATITHLFGEMLCLEAGKVRGLAMLAEVRHPEFPDIPTLREQGYGKDGGDSWFGVLAPTGTPLSVVAKLDQAIAASLRAADIMEKVHNGGMRVTYLGPADFKARIAAENKSFGEIIKKGNIKLT
ncbi:MAG: tripartite tricarboxylate transporter substrate-binding protein [Reyranella sp.]|nr:tripartite tricarboxylate transporter substrate-binding protein [Reyranella sp.]